MPNRPGLITHSCGHQTPIAAREFRHVDFVCASCASKPLTDTERRRARSQIRTGLAIETTCDDCGATVWNVDLDGLLCVDREGTWHVCPEQTACLCGDPFGAHP